MPRSDRHQVTVLLDDTDEERFSAYCGERGFKKSTLIVRLIREHLDREGFATQPGLLEQRKVRGTSASRSNQSSQTLRRRGVNQGHG